MGRGLALAAALTLGSGPAVASEALRIELAALAQDDALVFAASALAAEGPCDLSMSRDTRKVLWSGPDPTDPLWSQSVAVAALDMRQALLSQPPSERDRQCVVIERELREALPELAAELDALSGEEQRSTLELAARLLAAQRDCNLRFDPEAVRNVMKGPKEAAVTAWTRDLAAEMAASSERVYAMSSLAREVHCSLARERAEAVGLLAD